jgi:hypothetical protein
MTKQKNAVSATAARILRKAVKHILAMPTRYDQNEIITKVKAGEPFAFSSVGHFKAPTCGTVGCLAGWVTLLDLGLNEASKVDALRYAADKLELTAYQRERLFGGVHSWPNKFSAAYDNAKTPRGVARVAQRRVEHFIKTGD